MDATKYIISLTSQSVINISESVYMQKIFGDVKMGIFMDKNCTKIYDVYPGGTFRK